MSKFELSINVKYLPEWGVWEGIRELIQNGKDAETEHNAPLTVDWKGGTLRIENEGAILTREALLFGTTSKGGRADLIGKFGEGLKLGMLALVRAGRAIKVRSGGEVWVPTIVRSERYNADVLVVDIKEGNKDEKRVRVEISGVVESEWLDLRSRFTFLADKRHSVKDVVSTSSGSLLLHERHKGKVYVKGIFVMNEPALRYGYDIQEAELDRDRKMINSRELYSTIARIWNNAVRSRPDLFDPYFEMISAQGDEGADVKEVDYWTSPDNEVMDQIAARFKERFGKDAFPVISTDESEEMEHLGKRGVIVPKGLQSLLRNTVGDIDDVKRKLAKEIVKIYAIGELSLPQRKIYDKAMRLMTYAFETTMDALKERVDIVDFRDKGLNGLHNSSKGRIAISRKVLNQGIDATLEVLVHEFAHDQGADGHKSHVVTIERFWRNIVLQLRVQAAHNAGKGSDWVLGTED
jgi:hypothetical protein